MSFFDRFWRTETRAVTSLTGGSNIFRDGWAVAGGAGYPGDAHPTVQACVAAIAGTIAALPASIKRRGADGRLSEVPEHPFVQWVDQGPNEWQTWADFLEAFVGDCVLRGNALAKIVVEPTTGVATGLEFVPWSHVSPHQTASGRLVFDITKPTISGAAPATQERLLPGEYVHLRDRSDNGLLGVSRLSKAAQAVANANMLDQHLGAMIANGGGRPGSILKSEKELGEDAIERLRESLERFRTTGRGKTMVLEDGLDFSEVEQFSPSDMEMTEALRHQNVTICRLFGVPPVIVGALENASYSNASQLQRFFAQGTLSTWVRKVEAAFSKSVFVESERGEYVLDISLDGLLRGDPETRWAAHKIAADIGAADPATIARMEGLPEPSERPRDPARARSEEGAQ